MTREEALNILHNSSVYHPMYLDALNMAIKALEQEPKTGIWRKDIDNSRRWDRVRFYCSECGNWQTYGETDYCPSCGARMIKPQKE